MAEEKSTQGGQAVQTVLVVIVSVLLTALIVMLLNKNKPNASETATEANTEESDKEIAERLVRDASTLARRQNENNSELKEAYAAREAADKANEYSTDQIVKYKNEISELRVKLGQNTSFLKEAEGLRIENIQLKQNTDNYLIKIRELRDNNNTEVLKIRNTRLMAQVATLKNQLEEASEKSSNGGISEAEQKLLRSTLEGYKIRNKQLKEEIVLLRQKQNPINLFVEDANKLKGKAAGLFGKLRAANAANSVALAVMYNAIEAELGVGNVRKIKFSEGSSFVSDLEATHIAAKIKEAKADSHFLVVGYASTKGDAANNRKLSAKRATAVAGVILQNKMLGQTVEAVYLGQTDRFSKEDDTENQICEIWEIKK